MILLAVGETFTVSSGVQSLAVRQGGKHDSRLPERFVFFATSLYLPGYRQDPTEISKVDIG